MFPLSYNRKKELYISLNQEIMLKRFREEIEKKLQNSYIQNVESTHESICFKGTPFRFAWNGWNLFNGISSGTIEFKFITENKFFVKQKICFTESLLLALAFTLLVVFLWSYQPIAPIIAAVIWIPLFTGNYFLSFFRFNSFIDNLIMKLYDESVNPNAIVVEEEPMFDLPIDILK